MSLSLNRKVVPVIITEEFTSGWNISYADHWVGLIKTAAGWENTFLQECSYFIQRDADTRFLILIQGVPLLVTICAINKEILVCSDRASWELTLLQAHQSIPNSEYTESYTADLNLLRHHINKVAEILPQHGPSVIQTITGKFKLPDFSQEPQMDAVEEESIPLKKELIQKMNLYRLKIFERISNIGLKLTADYILFRIHLLKFLAILPSLDHDQEGSEVKRIFLETLRRLQEDNELAKSKEKTNQERALPNIYHIIFKLLSWLTYLLPASWVAGFIRKSVRIMARRFIAGENIQEAKQDFINLHSSGRCATLDQLGELVISEEEANHYAEEVIKLIRGLRQHIKPGEKNQAGILKAHVSIKVTALGSDFNPKAFDYTYAQIAPRLRKILLTAKEEQVFIHVDAEHYAYRDQVFEIYQKVLLETPGLHDFAHTGIVIQAYLRDAYSHFLQILELAKKRNLTMPVRLVKGAYWDAETVEGEAHDFIPPQFLNKEETDLHFRQLIYVFLQNAPHLQLCLASHNLHDHTWARVVRKKIFPQSPEIEHQCLHMTYEPLSFGLAKMGWATRNYIPVGSLLVGMAYLVRRIMENSSQVGILAITRTHKENKTQPSPQDIMLKKMREHKWQWDHQVRELSAEFRNITPCRLYLKKDYQMMERAIHVFSTNMGQHLIGSFPCHGALKEIICSTLNEQVVGKINLANEADTHQAIELSLTTYQKTFWKNDTFYRCATLLKAAQLMLKQRLNLSALIIYEGGKNMPEALADVDEAIDFLNFYAREEIRLHHEQGRGLHARGPVAVIAPWNFPLAIPCGMVAAALVAGNTVILKSSELTPLIAQKLVDLLQEAGVPPEVLIHLPGKGSVIGKILTNDPRMSGYVFTGSKEVGMNIATTVQSSLREDPLSQEPTLPLVITEMGGKNAIIVTASAELDETVSGILYSSFGHAGQKCSACSRIIIDSTIKERFLKRFASALECLKVGPAFDSSSYMNPVVSIKEKNRLQEMVSLAHQECAQWGGRVVVDRSQEKLPGACLGPSLIEVPYERAFMHESLAQRELFGPVAHVIAYDGLEQAIQLFNSTEYALTGGIYSQSQDDIDYLLQHLQAGNIYVNRPNTGARVQVEPFGGFKLSGTGPKAGGKSYVWAFHRPHPQSDRAVTQPLTWGTQDFFVPPSTQKFRDKILRAIMKKGIKSLIKNHDDLFQKSIAKTQSVTAENLENFRQWLKLNLIPFKTYFHWNRRIPGQLSYDQYGLCKDWGVFVAFHEIPSQRQFLFFLGALCAGSSITVLAMNKKAAKCWSRLGDFFHQAGISPGHLQIVWPTEKNYHHTLKQSHLQFAILDGDEPCINKVLKQIYSSLSSYQHMPSIHTHFEGPAVGDFEKFVLPFIQVRSLAINTMRHGAPLDAGLSKG